VFRCPVCVFLDVTHHLFLINNNKILNSNVLKKVVIFFVFAGWIRVFWASLSLRITGKMVQFSCFEVVFCVVLDVSHHLFFIKNLKILNSNVLKAFYQHLFLWEKKKMVQFLCFEVLFCVVLDVSHHLFFINNLKIFNSNVLNAFYNISFSEDMRKNGAIFKFPRRVFYGSGRELSIVLHK
jgi:hypothetical protein